MKLEGEYRFDATVQEVWDALFDPEILAAAMPGCDKLEVVDGDFVGEMNIKVGPVGGKFSGKVHVEDKVEPTSYRMIIDGKGGPGFVKATANIALSPDGDGARITYKADAQVGGRIASVGERLLDASAKAITKQSLEGLHENIKIRTAAHRAAKAAPITDPPAPASVAPAAEPEPAESSTAKPAEAATATTATASKPPETAAKPTESAPPAAAVPKPVYKKADAGAMAKTVAKEAVKTMWLTIVLAIVLLGLLVWVLVR
jgi:carbon monoxide dehydrogenase subunit G